MIKRLRAIKARPIEAKVLAVIADDRPIKAREMSLVTITIRELKAESARVTRTRAALEQVPSVVASGGPTLL